MQGKKMFKNSNIYTSFDDTKLDNRIMLGIIINSSLFNSPFSLHDDNEGDIIKSVYKYGFSILGPIMLYFTIWLINNTNK